MRKDWPFPERGWWYDGYRIIRSRLFEHRLDDQWSEFGRFHDFSHKQKKITVPCGRGKTVIFYLKPIFSANRSCAACSWPNAVAFGLLRYIKYTKLPRFRNCLIANRAHTAQERLSRPLTLLPPRRPNKVHEAARVLGRSNPLGRSAEFLRHATRSW